ncbi:MAG: hypothetical protein ABH885_02080 [Candidatus Omnitrophota bacterium]
MALRIILAGCLLACSTLIYAHTASAEVDLEANGFDWLNYSLNQKGEFVNAVFDINGIDKTKYSVKNGVEALDKFYYTIYKDGPKNADVTRFLEMKSVRILTDLINYKE